MRKGPMMILDKKQMTEEDIQLQAKSEREMKEVRSE